MGDDRICMYAIGNIEPFSWLKLLSIVTDEFEKSKERGKHGALFKLKPQKFTNTSNWDFGGLGIGEDAFKTW